MQFTFRLPRLLTAFDNDNNRIIMRNLCFVFVDSVEQKAKNDKEPEENRLGRTTNTKSLCMCTYLFRSVSFATTRLSSNRIYKYRFLQVVQTIYSAFSYVYTIECNSIHVLIVIFSVRFRNSHRMRE